MMEQDLVFAYRKWAGAMNTGSMEQALVWREIVKEVEAKVRAAYGQEAVDMCRADAADMGPVS